MSNRCARCRRKISVTESVYVVMLHRSGSKIDHTVERSSKAPAGALVMHASGDRDCGKEVSDFRVNVLKTLGLPIETSTECLELL